MGTLIEVSRDQFAAVVDAAGAALIEAGRQGATIAALCAATGLPERRCRRAVERLVAEGRARRDGERGRVFAITDDRGRVLEVDDRRARELADRRAHRELEALKGYVAGELADVIVLLDGRRVPPGLGGQAEGAQRYLRQAVKDVRSMPDQDALESLVAEARPAIEAVNQLLTTIEAAKRQTAQDQVAVRARLAQLKDERRRLVTALRQIETVRDRVAAIPGWEAYRAWEVVKGVGVLGRPLLVAGKWQSRPGRLSWLSTTGEVPVSCPLTGAETVFPATAGTGRGLTVTPNRDVLAGLLEDARGVVAGWLEDVDHERLSLTAGLISAHAIAYDTKSRMALEAPDRFSPALSSTDSRIGQPQRTAVSEMRAFCGRCGREHAFGPDLRCDGRVEQLQPSPEMSPEMRRFLAG